MHISSYDKSTSMLFSNQCCCFDTHLFRSDIIRDSLYKLVSEETRFKVSVASVDTSLYVQGPTIPPPPPAVYLINANQLPNQLRC